MRRPRVAPEPRKKLAAGGRSGQPDSSQPGHAVLFNVSPIGANIGLVSGILFATLLTFAERGRAIPSIPLGRAALWGALASAVFPLVTGREDQVFVICPIGAALAAASVAMARKATGSQIGGAETRAQCRSRSTCPPNGLKR